jgi:hypothetical protein
MCGSSLSFPRVCNDKVLLVGIMFVDTQWASKVALHHRGKRYRQVYYSQILLQS